MKNAKNLAAIAALYPQQEVVWVTSDGLIHLTLLEAESQARHLPSVRIKAHCLKKKYTT